MGVSFEEWMREVNAIVFEKVGLTLDDLPDQSYRDWFDAGLIPYEAFSEIVDEEGIFDGNE